MPGLNLLTGSGFFSVSGSEVTGPRDLCLTLSLGLAVEAVEAVEAAVSVFPLFLLRTCSLVLLCSAREAEAN